MTGDLTIDVSTDANETMQKKIWDYVLEHPGCIRRDVMDALGISAGTAYQSLIRLEKNGAARHDRVPMKLRYERKDGITEAVQHVQIWYAVPDFEWVGFVNGRGSWIQGRQPVMTSEQVRKRRIRKEIRTTGTCSAMRGGAFRKQIEERERNKKAALAVLEQAHKPMLSITIEREVGAPVSGALRELEKEGKVRRSYPRSHSTPYWAAV